MTAEQVTTIIDPSMRAIEAQELQSSNGVRIQLAKSLPRSLKGEEVHLAESMVLNSWDISSMAGANRILAMGSTSKEIHSTTLPVIKEGGSVVALKLAVKQINDHHAALKELDNLDRVRMQTRVRCVQPFAVIWVESGSRISTPAQLLTFLEVGVIPVERVRFDQFHPEQRDRFLEDLADFTASMANEGVSHQDFRTRNIGYDLTQGRVSRTRKTDFILFDGEGIKVMDRDELARMRDVDNRPDVVTLSRYAKWSNLFDEDATDLVDELATERHLRKGYLREHYALPYLQKRVPMLGQLSERAALAYIMGRKLLVD